MRRYKVLIVEDHPFQHEYLLHLFSELDGFDVSTVWDGATALRRLQVSAYDLVISDLFMPDMDGVQLIQNIARLPDPPALALMSVASRRMLISAGLVAENLNLKLLALISKPVDPTAPRHLRDSLDALRKTRDAKSNRPLQLDRKELMHALRGRQIQPWFQPKKSLHDGRVCSAEALARWQHPELGVIMPGQFLPAIEQLELEETLLWSMLDQTLEVQSQWRHRGFDVPVSVNLPTHLLGSHDLADRLRARVMATGAEPGSICFELLETSPTQALSDYYAGACRLRMMGFGLAQDDFGKGFSSYFNLVSTPFSELKIDRSLVHGCADSESLAAAVQSIVELSHKLGLTVTAEGVETSAELAFLRKNRCDQVQGFLICAAVPPEQFFELLCEDGLTPAPK